MPKLTRPSNPAQWLAMQLDKKQSHDQPNHHVSTDLRRIEGEVSELLKQALRMPTRKRAKRR